MSDVANISTICKNCVFAEFFQTESPQKTKHQIGCSLGLDEKYKKVTEFEYIEEEIDSYQVKYLKINKRYCIGCRDSSWLQKKPENIAKEEYIEKEWELPVTYVLYMDNTTVEEDIIRNIEEINNMQNIPCMVILVDNSDTHHIKMTRLRDIFTQLKTKWVTKINTEPDSNIEDCLNVVFNSVKGIYTSVYSAGAKLYDTINLKKAIRNLEQIIMITPDENNQGFTIMNHAFFARGKNYNVNIIEKIKKEAEEKQCQHLIRQISVLQ